MPEWRILFRRVQVQILLKFILQNSKPSDLTECETAQHLAFFKGEYGEP